MRFSIAVIALVLTTITASAKPTPINGFAAKVNGKIITKNELNESMKFRRLMISRIPDSKERSKQMSSLEKETLESLIERELIISEFDKRGGVVKPEMIDEDVRKIIRDEFGNDRSQFIAALKKEGTTIEKFRKVQEQRIAVNYMRSSEIKTNPMVSPTEIKKFYDTNTDLFREEGFIRLRTLTMSKQGTDGDIEAQKKLVAEIHAKLKAGADFGTLAKTYSIDSASVNGGDRGTIGRGTEELRRDLVGLAFMQETGQISQVHQDQAFYYIMKVESRKPGARAPLTDPKVREAIEKRLLSEKRKEAQDRWLERLKKTAIIKRY